MTVTITVTKVFMTLNMAFCLWAGILLALSFLKSTQRRRVVDGRIMREPLWWWHAILSAIFLFIAVVNGIGLSVQP
jgi:hypothetical protein